MSHVSINSNFDDALKHKIQNIVKIFDSIDTVQGSKLAEPVNLEEIFSQLRKFKNGKATTDLPNEIIKAGGEHMLRMLQILFNVIIENEIIPCDWTKGNIVPIFKKGGDKTCLGDYRGISFLSSFFQII